MRRLLFSFLLLLVACGGGSSHVDYKIAFDPGFNALSAPSRNSNLQAFTVELIEAIGKEQRITIALYDQNWDALVWGLQNRDYDAIISTMRPYLFYEKLYDFSELYLPTGPTLVVPIAVKIETLADMNDKIVAIQRGSESALILEKYPGVIQKTYEAIVPALSDTVSGAVDGAVLDILTAGAYCRNQFQGLLHIVLAPLNDEGLRIVSLKGASPALIRHFNEGLRKLHKNGKYQELMAKWGF